MTALNNSKYCEFTKVCHLNMFENQSYIYKKKNVSRIPNVVKVIFLKTVKKGLLGCTISNALLFFSDNKGRLKISKISYLS